MSRDRPESERRREVERAQEVGGATGESRSQPSSGGFIPFTWPSLPGRTPEQGAAPQGRSDDRLGESYDDNYDRERAQGRERGDADEERGMDDWLVAGLIVAGAALFLFPEPVTSVLGLVLMGAGALAWIADLAVQGGR